jgi:hypothetical protein
MNGSDEWIVWYVASFIFLVICGLNESTKICVLSFDTERVLIRSFGCRLIKKGSANATLILENVYDGNFVNETT